MMVTSLITVWKLPPVYSLFLESGALVSINFVIANLILLSRYKAFLAETNHSNSRLLLESDGRISLLCTTRCNRRRWT